MDTVLNVIAGAVLLYAALDRLNSMDGRTRFVVRMAACLLALAGASGILSCVSPVQVMPTLAIVGAAAWLVADGRENS